MKRLLVWVAIAAMTVVTAQANLLLNYGFESELSGSDWSSVWGAGQFLRETWNSPPEGSYAIYFKGGWSVGADNFGGGLQAVNSGIIGGETYELSAQFYWDNGWSAASQVIKLEFFDGSAGLLQAYTLNLTDLTEATWQTRSISGMAPVGSAYAQVVFEGNGFGADGVLAADNFSLTQQAIPEPSVALLGLLGGGLLVLLRRKVK